MVRLLLNVIWLLLAGIWLCIGYVIAACLLAITIIGIPFAVQAVKLAGFVIWPFGRSLVPSPTRSRGLSAVANILRFILAGWWLALEHVVTGALLCLTIVGVPLGLGNFKLAVAALAPFGKEIVDNRTVQAADAITFG